MHPRSHPTLKDLLVYWYMILLRSGNRFSYNGHKYKYFFHLYNATFRSERCVEIPIAKEILDSFRDKQILELGNVLSHYFPVKHDVLDKYETAPGIINEDVVRYHPTKKYDLIISVSTIEHIGWDETPRDSQKIIKAINNLRSLLKPEGLIFITAPLGANPFLDRIIRDKLVSFAELSFLKRLAKYCRWTEVSYQEASGAKYNFPFPFGNCILVGQIRHREKA